MNSFHTAQAFDHRAPWLLRCDLSRTLDAEAAVDFDDFVVSSPFAAYQQTRAWVDASPSRRLREYRFFRCFDGDRLIGAAVVRCRYLLAGHWLATVQRGPIVHDAALFGTVLEQLMDTLRAHGCCTVQLGPRVRGRDLPTMAEAMRDAGFAPLPPSRQPIHCTTGIVWLDKAEQDVFAGFKQRGRRQVRAAEKAGVIVRRVKDAADIAIYQQILDRQHDSRPTYDTTGLTDAAGQARMIERLGGAMLLAERDGTVIGCHAFVRQADEAIWLSLASADEDSSVPRAYALLWRAMVIARDMGCVGYDLAGLPVGNETDREEANRAQFKLAFAPTRRVMPPMHVAGLKPIAHGLLFSARQLYRAARALR